MRKEEREDRCPALVCISTSAASSFPSASSRTDGTGSGVLTSQVSSSANVGSRDVIVCVLGVSSCCDAGFLFPPSARRPFGLQKSQTSEK